MKKVLSFILAVALLCSTFAGLQITSHALSNSGNCGDNVTYTFDSKTGTVTISGTGDMYDYYYDSPFSGQSQITAVIINNGVTGIGDEAFKNCSGLTGVTLPAGVTKIGGYAFSGCSSLTSVTIPDSVISIGDEAFSRCSGLTSIAIPGSVTSIGSNAFSGTAYYKDESNWENGVLYIDHALIKANSSNIGNTYNIKNGTTCIAAYAFYYCIGLISITIPDSVKSIGNGVFYQSGLTSVTIGKSVTSIGNYAFEDCFDLKSVTIPDSVTSIGYRAFYNCNILNDVYYAGTEDEWNNISIGDDNFFVMVHFGGESKLPDSGKCGENVTYAFDSKTGTLTISGTGDMYNYWDNSPFRDQSKITTIIINNGVTNIGNRAFYNCSGLTSVTIPDSVISIGDEAFSYCSSLTSISLPAGVTSIGSNAFSGTAYYKDESNWENGVLYIDHALIKANSSNIGNTYNIKNGTTCIADSAFSYCSGLKSVTIPDNVTSIGYRAFYNCNILNDVYYAGTEDKWNNISIGDDNFFVMVHFGGESKLPDSGKCGENVTYAFDSKTGTLTISGTGDMYNYWDNSPFRDQSKITTIIINNGVTSIGNYAFQDCYSLTSITISDTVTRIGTLAFDSCCALKNITIPDSVTSIDVYAFDDCYDLTSIIIPDSVTTIQWYAFSGCSNLTDVYYAGTEDEWNDISIDKGNDYLTNATIHFNSTGGGGVQYTVSPLAKTGGTVYVYNGSELVCSADSADGTFTLNGVGAGTYDVYVKCKFGVLTKVAMALNVDGTELEPVEDVYIPIGDVNTDGLIDVSDISSILLDGIYATANEDYDIDGSGAVDINDVSTVLLATNYGAAAAVVG